MSAEHMQGKQRNSTGKYSTKTPGSASQKVMKRSSKQTSSAKKKRPITRAQVKQEQLIENLQTHYKKHKQIEIAIETAKKVEMSECTFSPTVN